MNCQNLKYSRSPVCTERNNEFLTSITKHTENIFVIFFMHMENNGLIFIINFNCWTVTSSLFLPKSSWYQPSILDNLICFFFISIVIPSSPSRNASAANFSCSYIPYKLHFICEYIYLLQDQIKVWKYIPGTVPNEFNSLKYTLQSSNTQYKFYSDYSNLPYKIR